MSKPTMQDIADALSVSRITVWKALSNRPGVSDSMRAQIHQKATEMGYFHTPSQDTTATVSAQLPPHTRTVAVAVCRPESSLFWMQIIHQIAKDLSEHNVNLMYTYLPTNYKAGYVLPEPLTNGTVDGVIVLNTYSAPCCGCYPLYLYQRFFWTRFPLSPITSYMGICSLLRVVTLSGRLQAICSVMDAESSVS